MAERTQPDNPASIDALLRANRERFDSLFERQMKVALAPLVPARRVRTASTAAPEAKAVQPESVHEPTSTVASSRAPRTDIKAELNRRFTIFWSSELLEQAIENGRAVVRCRLKVGDDACVEVGSSRVDEDGDEQAALQRAFDAALQKCAEHFTSGKHAGFGAQALGAPLAVALSPAERARQVAERARPIDAITIDRLQTALINICREMAVVRDRGTPSRAPRESQPAAALVADAQGRMLAGNLGSYVAYMLQQREWRFAPGDVLLQSDPYLCGGVVSQTNQWLVLVPVFVNAELIGFTSMAGPLADVGGATLGSMPVQAQSVFSEGTRIPPIKIAAGGVLNEAALELILNNSRAPQENRARLLALVAGCRAGAAAMMRERERMGGARYQQARAALLARTNELMRQFIRERIPEEPQSFQDQIDDDGCGNGPFRLKLTVWREGDHAYFDWTGSAAQAPGPINLKLNVGLAKAIAARFLARPLDPALLGNDGFHDLIHVTLPQGSIVNPQFPAAIGRGEQVLARHLEVLSSALGRHRPATLVPAGFGTAPSLRIGGTDESGIRYEFSELFDGGPTFPLAGEGVIAAAAQADATRTSIESLERDFPVVIESCASIADSGGAGLQPGACGVETVYRSTAAGQLSIHDDRHVSRPWGVNGGRAGATSARWVVRVDGTREPLPAKIDGLALAPGERIVFRTAGGGGGDPLQREPALVQQDVRSGLLTPDSAAAEYGVVLSGSQMDIDLRGTRTLREQIMRA